MKTYITILCFMMFAFSGMAQISFNGAHPLFDNQNFTFVFESTDATGRNVYTTAPIDGNQPCSGIGICELKIAWNNTESRWELLADDGNGGFSSNFLIFTNSQPSMPNPPDLSLGVWEENTVVTMGSAGGDLSPANSTMTGDVQSGLLSLPEVLDKQITLFPNPVNDVMYINSVKSISKVHIYDVHGRMVLNEKGNMKQVDVSQLSNGFYLVKIEVDNNQVAKKIWVE